MDNAKLLNIKILDRKVVNAVVDATEYHLGDYSISFNLNQQMWTLNDSRDHILYMDRDLGKVTDWYVNRYQSESFTSRLDELIEKSLKGI